MNKIEDRKGIHSTAGGADPIHFKKSQPLRLEKQTIRTLTGAELRLVAGGHCSDSKPALQ